MTTSMIGRLDHCILLAYRTPAAAVSHLLPPGLELMTHGQFAFWNIVACRVDKMRPAHTPQCLGMSYFHVAYRLYVRAKVRGGRWIEGLYFVRSDVDRILVAAGGNVMTDFRFHRAGIELRQDEQALYLSISGTSNADADLAAELAAPAELAAKSCFLSYEQAAAFLKYRPLGLSTNGRVLRLAEVFRDESAWKERPVRVVSAQWSFFGKHHLPEPQFELATWVEPIDYRWRLGRREELACPPASGEITIAPCALL